MVSILLTAPAFFDESLQRKRESAEVWDKADEEDGTGLYPVRVWNEIVNCGGSFCTITFERLCVPYTKTHDPAETADAAERESPAETIDAAEKEPLNKTINDVNNDAARAGSYFADYRLLVRDVDGNIMTEQIVACFPVCFEECYWIRDFSGDGFADLAFCTSYQIDEDYRRSDMRNTFFIWNEENSCFEESVLPLDAPTAWESVSVPLWNEELSVVISFAGNDDVAGNPVLEMYSFLHGEWQKVRRLESVYSEDEFESLDKPKFMGQRRELLYVGGEVTGESIVESGYDAGTVWCRRDSVWSRYYEGNLSLYPDAWYFAKMEESMEGVIVEKYVRIRQQEVAGDLTLRPESTTSEERNQGQNGTVADEGHMGETGEAYRRVYDSWSDMREDWDLPYAAQETFEVLLELYGQVDMLGDYEPGDTGLYPLYLDAFYKMIKQDELVTDLESGDAVVLSELSFFERPLYPLEEGEDAYQPELYEYYFFDVDGDGAPELTVHQHAAGFMVFDYDMRTDSYSVWYDAEACWYMLLGSKKVLWAWDGRYLAFYQLDESGKEVGETFCLSDYYNSEQAVYLVMLPKFAEGSEGGIEERAQGMYSRADDQWYFRVTGEQYAKITQRYWDAYETGQECMEQKALTYEELFGALTEAESDEYDNEVCGMFAYRDGE